MTDSDPAQPPEPPGAPIDFYFDFSSPYGYLAGHKIDGVARLYGREVNWRQVLPAGIFTATGAQPLLALPNKERQSGVLGNGVTVRLYLSGSRDRKKNNRKINR